LLYTLSTDCTENTASEKTSVIVCVSIAKGVCLPSHCLAMAAYSGSIIQAFIHHVTISWKHFVSLSYKQIHFNFEPQCAAFVVRQVKSLVTTFEGLQPSSHTIKIK
jgi:hypothetical protein